MSDPFQELDALRDRWLAVEPLPPEARDRLWKKLRLEWNYNSNHIEGNTLTYGETELLLLHDRTTGNHTHREYLEMKAHDVAIEHVGVLAADRDRLLTEGDIRDLNRILLKEPFWKGAETADGRPTRKEIVPGQYKTSPNNVRLPNGDIFYFTSVEDTPPKMAALAAWLRQELEAPTQHPVVLAAKLHHDFVQIHPFDDGNGRVARLLVNYVLMRHGFLPTVVRSDDKANYLTALHLADAGELSAFIAYFHRLAEWSLQLGLKAARGESIEEPSDLEKEVAIFVRGQEASRRIDSTEITEAIHKVIDASLQPLVAKVDSKLSRLSSLFARLAYKVNEPRLEGQYGPSLRLPRPLPIEAGDQFQIFCKFVEFQGRTAAAIDIEIVLSVRFQSKTYSLTLGDEVIASHDYDTPILSDEAERLSSQILAAAFDEIKRKTGEGG